MIVVFDTNAYLYLADGKDKEMIKRRVKMLREVESKHSEPIHAFICDTVAQELLSHLQEPMTNDDKLRFGACQAMYYHCGDEKQFLLLPQIWVQIAKELVDFDYQRLIKNQFNIGGMLFQLSKLREADDINTLDSNIKCNIKMIYDTIHETESLFVDFIQYIFDAWHKSNLSLSKEENKKRQKDLKDFLKTDNLLDFFMATVILQVLQISLYKDAGIILRHDANMLERVIEQNKIPTEQFRSMIKGLKEKNANPTNGARVNTIWDTLILFAAGKSVGGEKIVVVSGDRKMKTAANKVAQKEKRDNNEVISYVDYMGKLDLEELIPETLKKE